MAKSKMKDVTSEAEVFDKLGIQNPETPGGEPVVTTTGLPNEQEPAPDTSGEVEKPTQEALNLEGEQVPTEEQVSSTQDFEGNLTEEEKQRRTWQADADKAKVDKEKAEADKERLATELKQAQELNRNLSGAITPFMEKYGEKPGQQQTDPKPERDFIKDNYFDPNEFKLWSAEHDERVKAETKAEIKTELQQDQNTQTAQDQIAEVIKEYPEYVNPLTGQPDIARLQGDLQGFTQKKTMLDVVHEFKGKVVSKNPLDSDASISAIEKNANRPQSVVVSPETEPVKKEVPEQLLKLNKVFGDIELPPDFDGLKD